MNSFRKWLYKPKKTDKSLLAQFYFADEELNAVATELDSIDSRKDPERCQALVTQLRACQDKVLTIIQRTMTEAIPFARTSRDFRVKFPDDVVQENLAGQLWFGAECLAAGSSIMNRELESASMRPLARALTKNLDSLRHILRDQCLVNVAEYTERIREALIIFDKLFAEFELSYVSAMVPVKSVKEYETIQEITVLFSETTIRAKSLGYITTDMVDEYDPALMFTIPRLAIVCGLLVFADGPLNPDSQSWNMSDMFRPFQTLLHKIRELLFTLSDTELLTLERALCSQEEPDFLSSASPQSSTATQSTATAHSSSSSTITTTTIAVQTESPVFKRKTRADDAVSCSSLERLSSDYSDTVSPPLEEQGRLGKTACVEEIVCQSGRVSETSSSDTVFSEVEDNALPQAAHSDSPLHQVKNLNKSDSNDSGLHSDGVSTSDSQFTISSSDSNQLLYQSGVSSPLQTPSVDEVVELCMDQSGDAEGFNCATGDHGVKSYSYENDLCIGTDVCGQTTESAKGKSATSPVCKGASQDSMLAENEQEEEEEESFYTPSTGASPLHQPNANSSVPQSLQLADSQVMEAVQYLAASSDSWVESSVLCPTDYGAGPVHDNRVQDGMDEEQNSNVEESAGGDCDKKDKCDHEDDNDKENCEFCSIKGFATSGHCEENCQNTYQQFCGVQQKVEATFASEQAVAGEIVSVSVASDMSDSSLTDTTLTDLSSPSDSTFTPLSDPFLTDISPSRDTCDSAVHCVSLSHSDANGQENILQTFHENESQNQSPDLESGKVAEGGVTNPDTVSKREAGNTEVCQTSLNTGTNSDISHRQCDRCTQTPHSAINNSQSSKIHHHHHLRHNCQHSSSSVNSMSVSSISTKSTPEKSAQNRQGTKTGGEKKDSTNTHSTATNSRPLQSRTGKKSAICQRSSRTHNIKTRKSSHRAQNQKFQALKSRHSEPESEARLRQYADNWSDCSSNSEGDAKESKKTERRLQQGAVETSSGSSVCEGSSSTSDCESDQDSCGSSETSSYNSESRDDEEIALAVQAAELANRNQARARFRSSSDMIHRLFVCISGVADQLQTNFAGDLRNILRVVFNLNCSEPVVMEDEKTFRRYQRRGARFFHQQFGGDPSQNRALRDPPAWIPDDQSTMCMSCKTPFTFVRRRHHCRNCGKIFCGRCSSNAVSLPHFGHSKPVRVCNHCFVFQVNPFAMQAQI